MKIKIIPETRAVHALKQLDTDSGGKRTWLPDGYSRIFRSYEFGPGLWLRYDTLPSGNTGNEVFTHFTLLHLIMQSSR